MQEMHASFTVIWKCLIGKTVKEAEREFKEYGFKIISKGYLFRPDTMDKPIRRYEIINYVCNDKDAAFIRALNQKDKDANLKK